MPAPAPEVLLAGLVLGEGLRLFGKTSDKKKLKLSQSQLVGDGVMILIYTRA